MRLTPVQAMAYAVNLGKRFHRGAFRLFPEDCRQTCLLAALTSDVPEKKRIACAVEKEMTGLLYDLLGPERGSAYRMEHYSARRTRIFAAQRSRAMGETPEQAAAVANLSVSRVMATTHTYRSADEVRALRASGGAKGGVMGATARWGDFSARQTKARSLRAAGCKLTQIRDACGYKSISGVHYALQGESK